MMSGQGESQRPGAGIEGVQIALCRACQQNVLIEPFETEEKQKVTLEYL